MIIGKVRNREAVVELEVAGGAQAFRRIAAVIDTGYNGSLTLPVDVVSALQLAFAGHRRAQLADGSVIIMEVYQALVFWHGKPQDVLVSQSTGAPLLGMSLLSGSRLTLDVVKDGDVVIDELATRP